MTEPRRRDLVLALLRQQEWVSTAEIENAHVGGTQGTRRLRELRAAGWRIEQRRKAGSSQYEYHLDRGTAVVSEEAFAAKQEEPTPNGPDRNAGGAAGRDPDSRRDADHHLPFVAWHGDTHRGFTAKHRGYSMSVRPVWDDSQWVYVVTKPNGQQAYGRAPDLIAAKRQAIEAVL